MTTVVVTAADLPAVTTLAGDVATSDLLTQGLDALLVPVAPAAADADEGDGVQPRAGATEAAVRYGIDLGDLAERVRADGSAGSVHTIQLPRGAGDAALPWAGLPPRLVLVGTGAGTPVALRRAGAAVARATTGLGRVATTVGSGSDDGARAFVEGYLLGAYRHPSAATGAPPPPPAAELVLLGDYPDVEAVRVHAAASWTARVLAVTPSNIKSPAWLAEQAVVAAGQAGLTTDVLGPAELAAAGFGGIVAVGAGSASPPRLVVVRYVPPGGGGRHVVVAGKGITYDTGGLAIKPRESMVAMKTDMTGAAVALATVLGAAALQVPHRVTALLPLAENAFGASSYRPGDVVTVFGGTTVEVANPDAEGRMVLADALAYAAAELEPDVLVDVATLTGAATLGLGKQHGALFTPDDDLARALTAAGEAAGEPLWRMPLVPEYEKSLDSDVADVRHVAGPGAGAGAVTAALFLQRFAGGRTWAHLDIAGPARAAKAAHELPEGATGFGARALLRWLADA
ncbi:leucyl aminopeptidase family protein [Actinotalea fermentans]|uniref:Probable cytosol aminopeptidase n=1 Tax=Actinotalea fermentans TaxID=43671 RepID=A0A511YWM6_9CELL|nr:M17 family metallopeptidase [Actinotalea fermentans]GEN79621.1 leucyl aminopeptidase [Actinotalea fermentans]